MGEPVPEAAPATEPAPVPAAAPAAPLPEPEAPAAAAAEPGPMPELAALAAAAPELMPEPMFEPEVPIGMAPLVTAVKRAELGQGVEDETEGRVIILGAVVLEGGQGEMEMVDLGRGVSGWVSRIR